MNWNLCGRVKMIWQPYEISYDSIDTKYSLTVENTEGVATLSRRQSFVRTILWIVLCRLLIVYHSIGFIYLLWIASHMLRDIMTVVQYLSFDFRRLYSWIFFFLQLKVWSSLRIIIQPTITICLIKWLVGRNFWQQFVDAVLETSISLQICYVSDKFDTFFSYHI